MAVYESRRTDRMRQDPVMRTRQLQRRTNGASYQNIPTDIPQNKPQPLPLNDNPPCSEHIAKQEDSGDKHQGGFLEELIGGGLDSEKLLIAALIFLLLKEGADMKLILALGYILL